MREWMMKNKNRAIKYGLIAATTLSLNVNANEHNHKIKDYTFSAQELKALSNANQPQLSDDQFVFNNDLALLDWDDIFANYFPHLQPYKETIMHYAGYYSINPKLLISLIEYKSSLITNPSTTAYNSPLGDLSSKKGFKAQLKDVSEKLNKRFYAYKKISSQHKKVSYVLEHSPKSSSAATIAFASVLSNKHHSKTALNKVKNQTNQTNQTQLFITEQSKIESKISINSILSAYENVFGQNSEALMIEQQSQKVDTEHLQQSARLTSQAAVSTPNLYLPWTSGWSWKSGGAHGFDGSTWPLSSLDFYYPGGNTGWGGNKPAVYAAHAGTVTWYSRCNMRITHASGIATNYYHMDNLQYNSGSYINAGTYIGTYANTRSASLCEGGQSTGPHLHLSLLKNGYYESLQGYNFSGYYIQVGNSQYDTNCNRNYLWKNGSIYCAGNNIYKPYE